MGERAGRVPSLAQLFDLVEQLRLDESLAESERHRRDRAIGRRVAGGPRDRVLAWLAEVHSAGDSLAAVAMRSRRLLAALLIALGLGSGFGASRLVYAYDGARPVNIIEVLAFFVGAQLVMLSFTSISMLPAAARSRLPGIAALQDGLAVLSPGRWQAALAHVLPVARRQALALALGRGRAHQKLYGEVQRWAVLVASQSFAVAFHVGAIAAFVYLVSFTDLAFGWSTTLDVRSDELHRITRWIALPWCGWLAQACPTAPLIDATHYYRLAGGSLPGAPGLGGVDPAALGGWWPFCLAAMAVYGLLPRLLTWGLAHRRLRAAVRTAFDRTPGIDDLIERLDQPLIETVSPDAERTRTPQASKPADTAPVTPTRHCAVIDWGDVGLAQAELARAVESGLGLHVDFVRAAGGANPLDRDRALIRELGARHRESAIASVVAVRSWEPPIGEFVDFACELRAELGDAAALIVVPIAFDASGAAVEPPPADFGQWKRRLESIGDPWLSTRALVRS